MLILNLNFKQIWTLHNLTLILEITFQKCNLYWVTKCILFRVFYLSYLFLPFCLRSPCFRSQQGSQRDPLHWSNMHRVVYHQGDTPLCWQWMQAPLKVSVHKGPLCSVLKHRYFLGIMWKDQIYQIPHLLSIASQAIATLIFWNHI